MWVEGWAVEGSDGMVWEGSRVKVSVGHTRAEVAANAQIQEEKWLRKGLMRLDSELGGAALLALCTVTQSLLLPNY